MNPWAIETTPHREWRARFASIDATNSLTHASRLLRAVSEQSGQRGRGWGVSCPCISHGSAHFLGFCRFCSLWNEFGHNGRHVPARISTCLCHLDNSTTSSTRCVMLSPYRTKTHNHKHRPRNGFSPPPRVPHSPRLLRKEPRPLVHLFSETLTRCLANFGLPRLGINVLLVALTPLLVREDSIGHKAATFP